MRVLFASAFILSCTTAFALPTAVKKGLALGMGCVGPVSTKGPKLNICAIAGTKTRIWCPNGDIFDVDEDRAQVALVRSLCNLSQIL